MNTILPLSLLLALLTAFPSTTEAGCGSCCSFPSGVCNDWCTFEGGPSWNEQICTSYTTYYPDMQSCETCPPPPPAPTGPRCDADLGWPEGCPEECVDYQQEPSSSGYDPCWADEIVGYPAHAGLVNCALYEGDTYEKSLGQGSTTYTFTGKNKDGAACCCTDPERNTGMKARCCENEDKGAKFWKIVGIVVGSSVGCLCCWCWLRYLKLKKGRQSASQGGGSATVHQQMQMQMQVPQQGFQQPVPQQGFQQPVPASVAAFCVKCGNKNSGGDQFCKKCGNSFAL